jgi:hypothetical protein
MSELAKYTPEEAEARRQVVVEQLRTLAAEWFQLYPAEL